MKKYLLILFFTMFSAAAFSQETGGKLASVQTSATIKFFPNPATTSITFEFPNQVERGSTLQIYSFLGRKVMSVSLVNNRITLNVSELFKGVYVFQLRDANGRIVVSNKFQVTR